MYRQLQKRRGLLPVPDRRVLIVLGSLVGAMTLASGLLLALEPGSTTTSVSLRQVDRPADPVSRLFHTQSRLDATWTRIVIHDSGTTKGSAQALANSHQELGLDGSGYHFVIDNGRGDDNGRPDIHPTARWTGQSAGAFLNSLDPQHREQPNTIGICLIGDTDTETMDKPQMQQLVWLVQQLETRLRIPEAQVRVQTAGRRFPTATFRGQLLSGLGG